MIKTYIFKLNYTENTDNLEEELNQKISDTIKKEHFIEKSRNVTMSLAPDLKSLFFIVTCEIDYNYEWGPNNRSNRKASLF